jgi:CheY-like chemotaxis protein
VPKTLLLADDSVTIQRVVALAFAHEDVKVVAVGDGQQAIDEIRRSSPDLVLADIAMPGRSGYDVAQYVRSQPQFDALPVLLLAGAFEPADSEQAHLVGADGIITKPFDPAVLIARVTELLTRGRQATSGTASTATPGAPEALPSAYGDVSAPAPASGIDTYFEQIDQAFAALAKSSRVPVPPPRDEVPPDGAERPAGAHGTVPETQTRFGPAHPVSLSEAFAALLHAEKGASGAEAPRMAIQSNSALAAVDVEALADQVVRRVLQQLSDRVVRETVAEIVSSVAERLVREEIERIKRHIT